MSNIIIGNTTTITPTQAIQIGISPAVYRGEPGKPPRIGENGNWEIYNNRTGEWEDTGVAAAGGGSGGNTGEGDNVVEFDDVAPKPEGGDVVVFGNNGR